MAVHRDRVLFSNEALFVSPSATGFHYTGGNGIGLVTPPRNPIDTAGWQCGNPFPPWNPNGEDPAYASGQGTVIQQLKRIQSCSYGFNTNLTDVIQYGQLNRISAASVNEPLVNLEFSYYLLDGFNERQIGLVINGTESPLSQDVSGSDGKNYFIETVPSSRSVVTGDINIPNSKKTVVSIGNGFVTNYTASMAVSEIPTATVTVDAYNIQANIGATGIDIPAINPQNGALMSDAWVKGEHGTCKPDSCTSLFSLPAASRAYDGCGDVAALRPGDVVLTLRNAAMISQQISGAGALPAGTALIQSATVDMPMPRSSLKRIGNKYPFTKSLALPLLVYLDIEATVSEIKRADLADLLCSCSEHELLITIYNPSCAPCHFGGKREEDIAIQYKFTHARLESENFSSAIGQNKSVSLRFSTQLGAE